MSEQRAGVAYGLAAFGWWGLAPFYFHALARVSPWEILAHRIVGSLLLLVVFQAVAGRLAALRALLRDRRTLSLLAVSTLLVSTNWTLFIWSIATGRLLDASFGYFVNPLINVLLGFVLLGERFSRRQGLSLLLALAGVLVLGFGYGRPPWISLTLALSFGGYGLLRKRARTGAVAGLTVETLLAAPFALAYLLWLDHAGRLAFGHAGAGTTWLLAAAGVITALPLLWFVAAARRLRYATVGLLQYVAPTLQFLVAVLAFGEAFTGTHAVSFGLIWCALGLYSWDSLRPRQRSEIS
ncbi:MAG: EamA family transporter RarD [Candidatus Latescibacteria bacterium]|nr:EamA family transporter RarD [Candidatus Latescibacterota bacterium]